MGSNRLIDQQPCFSKARGMLLQLTSPILGCSSSCCLQNSEYCSCSISCIYQGITGFIDSRAARARWLQEVALQRLVYRVQHKVCYKLPLHIAAPIQCYAMP